MDIRIQEKLDQLVADMNLLKKKMILEPDVEAMATLSAFLFLTAGRRADTDKYVECKKYFRRNVNVFSEMRGIASVLIITKMCLSTNYQEYLSGIMAVYKMLRSIHKFSASPYMVLTAINIYEGGGLEKADENIAKLESVYKDMKADHFWLTGREDRPFLAMMVSRDIDYNSISAEISACYEACKKMSFSKEAMHTASQIMAISGKDVQTKVADLKATMDAFKLNKISGMKHELMPMAAAIGLVEGDPDTKAVAIKEIYDYLKKQKGFRWYIGRTKRSLYSMLAYTIENVNADKAALNSVISTTLTNIIIEEIIMMIIVTSAANSATNSATNK